MECGGRDIDDKARLYAETQIQKVNCHYVRSETQEIVGFLTDEMMSCGLLQTKLPKCFCLNKVAILNLT